MDGKNITELAKVLSDQIQEERFRKKAAVTRDILTLVGAGVFLAASVALPNLPRTLKPFLKNESDYEVWKRFNIRYLKRTIQRLEKQKLVEIGEADGMQIVVITEKGKKKILKFAIEEMRVDRPNQWDKKWRLVSFDLPEKLAKKRKIIVEYMHAWKFYPLHKSVYLHAYPCMQEIEFLREYLDVGEHIRIFTVTGLENEVSFKEHFGV